MQGPAPGVRASRSGAKLVASPCEGRQRLGHARRLGRRQICHACQSDIYHACQLDLGEETPGALARREWIQVGGGARGGGSGAPSPHGRPGASQTREAMLGVLARREWTLVGGGARGGGSGAPSPQGRPGASQERPGSVPCFQERTRNALGAPPECFRSTQGIVGLSKGPWGGLGVPSGALGCVLGSMGRPWAAFGGPWGCWR